VRTLVLVGSLNIAYGVLGAGILLAARVGPTRVRSPDFALLSFAIGVTAAGILTAQLALIDRLPGLVGTWILAATALLLGVVRRAREAPRVSWFDAPASKTDVVPAVAAAACLVVIFLQVHALPLGPWDGWAIWATKARALFEWGGVGSPALRSPTYTGSHLDYPLLLPSLEASQLRAVSSFDGVRLHLVLVTLGAAFAAGFLALSRRFAPVAVRTVVVVAILASPSFVTRLGSNYADVPLAIFVALGVVSLGGWFLTQEHSFVVFGGLFFGAAMLTKNEGLLFASAAFVAALLTGMDRGRRRPLLYTALAAAAVAAPWRLFAATHGLTDPDYDLGAALDPTFLSGRVDRIPPAMSALLSSLVRRWDYLQVVPLAATAVALQSKRLRLLGFLASFAAMALGALVCIYWISLLPIHHHLAVSADRVVSSVVISAVAMSALIVGQAVADRRNLQ
jgi:hypothetical protein